MTMEMNCRTFRSLAYSRHRVYLKVKIRSFINRQKIRPICETCATSEGIENSTIDIDLKLRFIKVRLDPTYIVATNTNMYMFSQKQFVTDATKRCQTLLNDSDIQIYRYIILYLSYQIYLSLSIEKDKNCWITAQLVIVDLP